MISSCCSQSKLSSEMYTSTGTLELMTTSMCLVPAAGEADEDALPALAEAVAAVAKSSYSSEPKRCLQEPSSKTK